VVRARQLSNTLVAATIVMFTALRKQLTAGDEVWGQGGRQAGKAQAGKAQAVSSAYSVSSPHGAHVVKECVS
jgi:hypothetical protein